MSVQRERSGPEMATGPVPSVDELTTMFAALTVRPKRSGKTTAVVVASPRPARKLLDLPAELLNSMLLLIYHPADKAALIRTCKTMHKLVLPMLYHEIVLDVTTPNAKQLATYQGSNPGLAHLRSLTLTSGRGGFATAQVKHTVYRIFRRIPARAWDKLRWQTDGALLASSIVDVNDMRARLWLMLSNAVRDRSSTAVLTLARDMEQYMPSKSTHGMVEVLGEQKSGLSRDIGSKDFLEVTFSMDGGISVWNLCIETKKFLSSIGYVRETPEALETPDYLEILDASSKPSRPTLLVHGGCLMGFTCLGTGHLPSWRCRNLTSLTLQDCVFPFDFLAWLSLHKVAMSLKVLIVTVLDFVDAAWLARRPASLKDVESILDTFLLGFKGLRTLVVSAPFSRLPGSGAIANHATTLKELYIARSQNHLMPNSKHWTGTEEWVAAVCLACTKLEQVALPLPELWLQTMILDDDPYPNPSFSRLNGETRSWIYSGYVKFSSCVASLAKLPRLVTIRFLNIYGLDWPATREGSDIVSVSYRTEKLASLVLRFFHEKQSELTVISFGSRGEIAGDDIEDGPRCYFVHGSRLRDWKEKRASMVQMKAARVKSEELRTEILDVRHDRYVDVGYLRFPRLTK